MQIDHLCQTCPNLAISNPQQPGITELHLDPPPQPKLPEESPLPPPQTTLDSPKAQAHSQQAHKGQILDAEWGNKSCWISFKMHKGKFKG